MYIDCILHVLRDGTPHTLKDIMAELGVPTLNEKKVGFCLSFLDEYGFVELLADSSWRLKLPVIRFLEKLQELDA